VKREKRKEERGERRREGRGAPVGERAECESSQKRREERR
jgi:hypothetical protein